MRWPFLLFFLSSALNPCTDFLGIFFFFTENTVPSEQPCCQLLLFYDTPEGTQIYPTEHIGWTQGQILSACFS